MLKKFLAAVALSLSFLTPAVALDKAELPKAEIQMFSPVVQLNGDCSGTVVYSKRDEKTNKVATYVVTAKHCVEKKDKFLITAPNYGDLQVEQRYTGYKASLVGVHDTVDAALIKLNDTSTVFPNVAKLAKVDAPLKFGEDVWTVGYPFGLSRNVTEGVLSNMDSIPQIGNGSPVLRASPNVGPGNSGGALFHRDSDGNFEQIGIMTHTRADYSWYGIYTPLFSIYEMLDKLAPEVVQD